MELRITDNIKEANLVTHDSKFHPDDVFSTAFMAKLIDNPVVYRKSVRKIEETDAIVYDVDLGKFDHHMADAKRDEKGMKYCGFGLLWEEFGRKYLENINVSDVEKMFKRVKEELIEQINGVDNGVFPKIEAPYKVMDLDKVIDLYNNTWEEETDNNDNFMRAVRVASDIFDLVIKKQLSLLKAEAIVEDALDSVKDNILILDRYLPYSDTIFDSKNVNAKLVKVVITPSNRGGYNIKPITISKESKDLLIDFPLEYRGKDSMELVRLSGIETLRFVHASGFLANTETLEDAIKLAHQAIDNGKL